MKNSTRFLVAGCLAGALALAGCSGTSSPTDDAADVIQSQEEVAQSEPQSEEPAEPEEPSEADLEAYFAGLATDDPVKIREVMPLAAPGSNAYSYAEYFAAVQGATWAADLYEGPRISTRTDDGFELCPQEVAEDNPCFQYTNIQHEGDKISDFEINGESLNGRLTIGSGDVQALGEIADAELLAVYRSARGYIVSVFEVTPKSDGLLLWGTYTAPDSQQYEPIGWTVPTERPVGAATLYSFYFDSRDFGGSIMLEGMVEDGSETWWVPFSTE